VIISSPVFYFLGTVVGSNGLLPAVVLSIAGCYLFIFFASLYSTPVTLYDAYSIFYLFGGYGTLPHLYSQVWSCRTGCRLFCLCAIPQGWTVLVGCGIYSVFRVFCGVLQVLISLNVRTGSGLLFRSGVAALVAITDGGCAAALMAYMHCCRNGIRRCAHCAFTLADCCLWWCMCCTWVWYARPVIGMLYCACQLRTDGPDGFCFTHRATPRRTRTFFPAGSLPVLRCASHTCRTFIRFTFYAC